MRFFTLFLILIMVFSVSVCAEAKEVKSSSPFKSMVLKMFGYTTKTVEKEVNAVGRGIKKGADVVVEEVKDIGGLATGDVSKTKDVLVKPVKGVTETAGETAYDVLNAPIESAEEMK